MKELSLHILDVAQNSLSAQATAVDLTVSQLAGRLTITIADDGRGMDRALLETVTDPFTTTRTTRRVGLGLPLLKLAAEQTGGGLEIVSAPGEGTTVTAVFDGESIDCPPLGDMAGTVSLLAQGMGDGVELTYTRTTETGTFRFDTRDIRAILGPEVSLGEAEVVKWMAAYIREGEAERGG